MQNIICLLSAAATLCVHTLCAQTLSKETILIETSFGTMKVKLYEETPLHKKNFLRLVSEKFYDSTLFHRVINEFMIQGGDPLSRTARQGDSLGHGDPGYTIPAEFNRKIIHKKGRLCAAREGDDLNPEMASSGSQFYIVMGKVRTEEDLKKYELRIQKNRFMRIQRAYQRSAEGRSDSLLLARFKKQNKTDSLTLIETRTQRYIEQKMKEVPDYRFDEYQRQTYLSEPGTPHLDGSYTVFGEVTEGLEIIDRIAAAPKDARDRPVTDIRIRMRIER